jgi:hypothetical protein
MIIPLPPAICHLPPATICHLLSATCHLPSATCHLHLPPATCHLPHLPLPSSSSLLPKGFLKLCELGRLCLYAASGFHTLFWLARWQYRCDQPIHHQWLGHLPMYFVQCAEVCRQHWFLLFTSAPRLYEGIATSCEPYTYFDAEVSCPTLFLLFTSAPLTMGAMAISV